MTRTAWPSERQEEALALYLAHGSIEASAQTGIPAGTIRRWACDRGVTAGRMEALKATAASRRNAADVARAELRDQLLEVAGEMVSKVHEMMGGEWSGRDARDLMVAAGIALDKYRLEMGEATGREETLTLSAVERGIALLEAQQSEDAAIERSHEALPG